MQPLPHKTQATYKVDGCKIYNCKEGDIILGIEPPKPPTKLKEEASHIKNASQGDVPYSGPLQVSGSSGFAWAKRRVDDSSVRSRSRSSSRSLIFEPSGALQMKNSFESKRLENGEVIRRSRTNSRDEESYDVVKNAMLKHWSQIERPRFFWCFGWVPLTRTVAGTLSKRGDGC